MNRALRIGLLLAALLLPQAILFFPSLSGQRILLPLDVLRQTGVYMPPESPRLYESPQWLISDTVLQTETDRRYLAAEMRAGRAPLWNPYNYVGGPFMANQPETLSPSILFHILWPGPQRLAWFHLLCSLFAGLGMYGFLRRACGLAAGPAILGAAVFPLCGFLVLWTGYTLHLTVTVLPWALWATNAVMRSKGWGVAVAALAGATFLALTGGCQGTAGFVLVLSALWIGVEFLRGGVAWKSVFRVAAGWTLGLLLAAPVYAQGIPYLLTSRRVVERLANAAPPFPACGWESLAQLWMPFHHGSMVAGSGVLLSMQGVLNESVAAAFCGAFLLLALAPMGLLYGRDRRLVWGFAALSFAGLAWHANLPGFHELFRLPPLVILRGNRSPLFTVVGLIGLAAMGLDGWLRRDGVPRGRTRFAAWCRFSFGAAAAAVAAYCLWSSFHPDPRAIQAGAESVAWFRRTYLACFAWSACAVLWWVIVWYVGPPRPSVAGERGRWNPNLLAGFAVVLSISELAVSARGLNPQSDPALYYPRLPVLEALTHQPWGRVVGMRCLSPSLLRLYRLPDIRGYDAADPIATIRLLRAACPGWREEPEYAVTQWLVPKATPAIDMLGVRYLVYFGQAPSQPPRGLRVLLKGDGMWVAENPKAMPQVFVPGRVLGVESCEAALSAIAAPGFDPAATVYVEGLLPPAGEHKTTGSAQVLEFQAGRVDATVKMDVPGVVVLNDIWYPGWRALVDGARTAALRVNGGLIGVRLQAGEHRVTWTYRPITWLAGLAAMALALVAIACLLLRRHSHSL